MEYTLCWNSREMIDTRKQFKNPIPHSAPHPLPSRVLAMSVMRPSIIFHISSDTFLPFSRQFSSHSRPKRSGCHLRRSFRSHSKLYNPDARNSLSTSCLHARMPSGSDLAATHKARPHVVIAAGRYGNWDNSVPCAPPSVAAGIGGFNCWFRTSNFFGVLPPAAATADVNRVPTCRAHCSYASRAAGSGVNSFDMGTPLAPLWSGARFLCFAFGFVLDSEKKFEAKDSKASSLTSSIDAAQVPSLRIATNWSAVVGSSATYYTQC